MPDSCQNLWKKNKIISKTSHKKKKTKTNQRRVAGVEVLRPNILIALVTLPVWRRHSLDVFLFEIEQGDYVSVFELSH